MKADRGNVLSKVSKISETFHLCFRLPRTRAGCILERAAGQQLILIVGMKTAASHGCLSASNVVYLQGEFSIFVFTLKRRLSNCISNRDTMGNGKEKNVIDA